MNKEAIIEPIVFIDENIPFLDKMLSCCADVKTFSGRELDSRTLKESGCNALFVRSTTKVNKELLEDTNVEFVASATSGIDHVDSDYLRDNDIFFASAPGSNANSVAEYVIYAALLWSNIYAEPLKGKSLGIIGYGHIGSLVAKYAHLLGMKIYINDPPLRDIGSSFPEYAEYTELEQIFKKSDLVTNHVPLQHSGKYPTCQLINERLLTLLKPCSMLIHASRGGVLCEKHLLDVLYSFKLHTVIDVWKSEPDISVPLAHESLIATPHIAGYSREGKLRGVLMIARAFQQYSGLTPNFALIDKEYSKYKPVERSFYEHADKLFRQLHLSRRFDEDHTSLIKTLNYPDQERQRAFDMLRRNYPLRHESL